MLREPIVLTFVFAFPALTVVVLGGVFDGDGDGSDFGGADPRHWYLAAYIGVVIAAIGLIMLPVHLAGYRERGVLRRFQVSRFPRWALPTAHVLVGFAMCAVGIVVIAAVVALTGGVPAPHDWARTIFGVALGTLAFVSVGVALGLLLPSARSAQGLGMLLFFPFLLLSGAGPPPNAMGDGMRTVSDAIPLTHVIRSIQEPWLGLGVPNDHYAVVAGTARARDRHLVRGGGQEPGLRHRVSGDGLFACSMNSSARLGGAHANQPSMIASRNARLATFFNWIRTAAYPSKCGIVKKALGCAASTASFSPRSSTRTARIGPSGGLASPNRRMSALLNGRSHAKALPATDHVRVPWRSTLRDLRQVQGHPRRLVDAHHPSDRSTDHRSAGGRAGRSLIRSPRRTAGAQDMGRGAFDHVKAGLRVGSGRCRVFVAWSRVDEDRVATGAVHSSGDRIAQRHGQSSSTMLGHDSQGLDLGNAGGRVEPGDAAPSECLVRRDCHEVEVGVVQPDAPGLPHSRPG